MPPSIYSTMLNCGTIGSSTTAARSHGSNLCCSSPLDSGRTDKPLSTTALGGDEAVWEGSNSSDVLFEAAGDGDDALQADGGSGERGMGSNDFLAAGEGDDVLHVDDGRFALRPDVGGNALSSGGGLDAHITNGDLVVGGALNIGYCSTCGLDKGVLGSGDGILDGDGGGPDTDGEYVT
jgi:hypothetical protein